MCVSNVIAQIRPEVSFTVRIANLSHDLFTLPKNQKLGIFLHAPVQDQVFAISFDGDSTSSVTPSTDASEVDAPTLYTHGDPKKALESHFNFNVDNIALDNLTQ